MEEFSPENVITGITRDLTLLTEVIERLHDSGYIWNFTLHGKQWKCLQNQVCYDTKDICIDEIYRCDDRSGILQDFSLYALREKWHGIKGILIADLTGSRYPLGNSYPGEHKA